MSTLSLHLKTLKEKNPWYVEHYGLKHVVTEANYRPDFEQLGIKIIEERFHAKDTANIHDLCWHGVSDHWHYIIDVPFNILTKAYDHKRNWATVLGIAHDIITPPKNHGSIKTQEHYDNLMFYLANYPQEFPTEVFNNDEEIEDEEEDENLSEDDIDKKLEEELYEANQKLTQQLKDLEKETEIKKKIILDKISQKRVHLNQVKEITKETLNEKRAIEASQIRQEAKQERQELVDKVRGVEYLNTSEIADLRREQKFLEEVKNIFPKFLDTTEDDVTEAKAGIDKNVILNKINNAYSYIKTCRMNDLNTQKNKSLTLDEIIEIQNYPGFNHTNRYMLKMMHTLFTKLYRDNKCCIFWICGVPSSGKSLFMSLLGNIMGPRVGLDKTQLYQDTLYANKLCEKGANSVTFEEYDINSEKSEHIEKAIARLKALTSGKPETFRVALNDKNKKKNDILNIKLVAITSNQHFTSIWQASNDRGFLDRLCTQQIDEEIPKNIRYNMNDQYKTEIMYTRYFYQIVWKNWLKNGCPPYEQLQKIPYHKQTIKYSEGCMDLLKYGCIKPEEKVDEIIDEDMITDY